MKTLMAGALANGVSKDAISEAPTRLAFHAGWPSAIGAAAVAREVFNQRP